MGGQAAYSDNGRPGLIDRAGRAILKVKKSILREDYNDYSYQQ